MNFLDTLQRLVGSRKAVLAVVAMLTVCVLAATHQITGEEAINFNKWILVVWLGSQAAVDAAEKLNATPGAPTEASPSDPSKANPATIPPAPPAPSPEVKS